jgi:hypothetical protein
MTPGYRAARPSSTHELFFGVFQFPADLIALNAVKDWKRRSGKSACLIEEFWSWRVRGLRGVLRHLDTFDAVFTSCAQSVDTLQRYLSVPVEYLPPGVDSLLFAPTTALEARPIAVCNIGRRSEDVHEQLLKWSKRAARFYYFDSLAHKRVVRDPGQHRYLLASILKRSGFFLANHAKFNVSTDTAEQQEVGFRFFEGTAGGAILIGTPPCNEQFEQLFPWRDAIIVPENGSDGLGEFLECLESDPDRLLAARRQNVLGALQRHDWLYRWLQVLKAVGIAPGDEVAKRMRALGAAASRFDDASVVESGDPLQIGSGAESSREL